MIACDTSSFSAFLAGEAGEDVEKLDFALRSRRIVLPAATLTEILSNPVTTPAAANIIAGCRVLEPDYGFWHRAAASRSKLIGLKLKARLADALIAQSCIDANVALITRDKDFRHFAQHCGLKLA